MSKKKAIYVCTIVCLPAEVAFSLKESVFMTTGVRCCWGGLELEEGAPDPATTLIDALRIFPALLGVLFIVGSGH